MSNIVNDIKNIYNNISKEFNNTRYSRWKGVKDFLDSIEKNSLLGDFGCGNGKYLKYRKDIFTIGIDISDKLLEIIKNNIIDSNLLQCNISNNLPFRDNTFDNIISIAVIHHLPTNEIRKKYLKEIVRVSKKYSKIFITMWSIESIKNDWKYLGNNDYLVPWKTKDKIYERFYHIFSKEDCINMINSVDNLFIENITYEKENWQITLRNNKI